VIQQQHFQQQQELDHDRLEHELVLQQQHFQQ
jgi:hypothetical protein